MSETPIHDQVVADLGPLYGPIDTEYTVLVAQAVMAMVEGQPA